MAQAENCPPFHHMQWTQIPDGPRPTSSFGLKLMLPSRSSHEGLYVLGGVLGPPASVYVASWRTLTAVGTLSRAHNGLHHDWPRSMCCRSCTDAHLSIACVVRRSLYMLAWSF